MCGRGSAGRVAIATRKQKSYKPQRKPGRREGASWLPDRHSQLTCWSVPDPAWTRLRLTPFQWNRRRGEGKASRRDALGLNERWQRTEDTPGMRDRWSKAREGFWLPTPMIVPSGSCCGRTGPGSDRTGASRGCTGRKGTSSRCGWGQSLLQGPLQWCTSTSLCL